MIGWDTVFIFGKVARNEPSSLQSNPVNGNNLPLRIPLLLAQSLILGVCLDLLDKKWLDFLRDAYDQMMLGLNEAGKELPANSAFGENDFDFKKRELDCAVIRFAVELAETKMAIKFDSVRAAFWEGKELYPQAGFKTHNHIQLSIINPDCIKGIFLPRQKTNS